MFIGCLFITIFLIGAGAMVMLFRSVIRADALEQQQKYPELFTKAKPAVKPKPKNQSIWLTFRGAQIALGILWLFDGLLQLQHQMFTKAFITKVIAVAAQGQPHFVGSAMNLGIHLFLLHPAIFNSLAALTQICLGILILYKRTTKLGLLLSIPWGGHCMGVWRGVWGYFHWTYLAAHGRSRRSATLCTHSTCGAAKKE